MKDAPATALDWPELRLLVETFGKHGWHCSRSSFEGSRDQHEAKRLRSIRRSEMSDHDVSLFVQHCLFAGVSARDPSLAKALMYILPVWAPLIAARRETSDLSVGTLTSSLTFARWESWESPEPEVVRSFVLRTWLDRLDHSGGGLDFKVLAAWLKEVDPLLDAWARATSARSIQNLADFVLGWDWVGVRRTTFVGATAEDERRFRSRTETWLTSNAIDQLRAATAIENVERVSQAIEILACMRVATGGSS